MKNYLIAAAAPLVMLASPVMAQDATLDMGGFYGGIVAGADSVRLSDGVDHGSETDIAYGGVVGYDYDTGSAVFGVEGEFTDSGVSVGLTDVVVAGDEARLSASRDLYVGLRAGFKANPTLLIYAKGGYTDARLKGTYDDGTTVYSESDTLDGYRIGLGFEQKLGGMLALRAEYRYSDYGEYSYQGFATGISASRHQGMLGLIGKF